MRQQAKLSCGSTAPSKLDRPSYPSARQIGHLVRDLLHGLFRPRQAPAPLGAHRTERSEGGRAEGAEICMTYNHANLSRNLDSCGLSDRSLLMVEFFVLPNPKNEIIPHPVQVPHGTLKGETGMIEGLSALTPSQLKRCRELAGLSVTKFAAECGLNRSLSLREMENGKRSISGPIARNALTLAGIWPYEVREPRLFADTEIQLDLLPSADPEGETSIDRALAAVEARP